MLDILATLLMRLCLTHWIVDTSVQCLLGMLISKLVGLDTYSQKSYSIYLIHIVVLFFGCSAWGLHSNGFNSCVTAWNIAPIAQLVSALDLVTSSVQVEGSILTAGKRLSLKNLNVIIRAINQLV